MKRFLFCLACVGFASVSYAQMDGFQITARTQGVPDSTVYLVASNADTIACTQMKRGMFVFKGKVTEPDVAYVRPASAPAVIPVMLENANFQILASPSGIQVVGGEAQDIYNRYTQLTQETQAEQNRVQKELQEYVQAGDQMKAQGLMNDFQKYVEKARAKEVAMFDTLNHSFVGMYVLASNMHGMPASMLRERYDKFSDKLKQTPNGKAVASYLENVERLSVGKIVPDFSMPNAEGDTLSLHAIKGKVKIVDFWASWCGPCRKESSTLVKLYKNYQTRGLEIVGVSIDDKADAWKKAMFEDGMTWKALCDLKGSQSPVIPLFNIKSIPFTLVLDADNRIVAVNLRGKELEQKIEELLK